MALENSSGFLRLFIAIAVPPEVRAEIGRVQGRLKREAPPGTVRWTRPDQFHITLKFLGDVPLNQVEALKNCVAPICATSPVLQITARGIGFFPNTRKPRVIWVGAHDDHGSLAELHRRIDETLRWLAPSERPETFTCHITLGRFKPGHHKATPQIVEQAAAFREWQFGEWMAEEVEIVCSKLTPDGAEHTPTISYRLLVGPD